MRYSLGNIAPVKNDPDDDPYDRQDGWCPLGRNEQRQSRELLWVGILAVVALIAAGLS
jgi:hypothetical protein